MRHSAPRCGVSVHLPHGDQEIADQARNDVKRGREAIVMVFQSALYTFQLKEKPPS